jgi:hypothetical protein
MGETFHDLDFIGIFSRDRPDRLGKKGYDIAKVSRLSNREKYRAAFSEWHKQDVSSLEEAFLDFPLRYRPFRAPDHMAVDIERVCSNLLANTNGMDDCSSMSFIAFIPRIVQKLWRTTIYGGELVISCLVVGLALITFASWFRHTLPSIYYRETHRTVGHVGKPLKLKLCDSWKNGNGLHKQNPARWSWARAD